MTEKYNKRKISGEKMTIVLKLNGKDQKNVFIVIKNFEFEQNGNVNYVKKKYHTIR